MRRKRICRRRGGDGEGRDKLLRVRKIEGEGGRGIGKMMKRRRVNSVLRRRG